MKSKIVELTADQVQERKLAALADTLLAKIAREQSVITSFVNAITSGEAARAFEGSSNSFNAAARLKVYGDVFSAITGSDGKPELRRAKSDGTSFNTLDNLIEFSQKEVNRRATSQMRSSSPTSNLMSQEYLAAWAEVIEMILWS